MSALSDEMLSFLESRLRSIYIFREILVTDAIYKSPLGLLLETHLLLSKKKICDHLFSASSNTPEKANQV
jgi:hypothetical protein